ncbi:MAG TPA: RNA polymerase-associated protein RapA [Vicinamibacteria bacterium]|nr:RNA polymerase-associated protein RapA [Vicinamibacteria bacterium]
MPPYVVGQRFVSEAEPELGLGKVEHIDRRSLVLRFPASDTLRRYAASSAPIRRVAFRVGDEIEDQRGRRLRIEEVVEREGLFIYGGGKRRIPESDLSGSLTFGRPEVRLLSGLWDSSRGFDLRRRALDHRYAILRSEARGFLGGRIQLLPHQIGIAREVASRLRPRALLADEVGLGKTIEAGLILHRLLRSGQARRVLILVPEPLVHQWFVEMFRRFHLSFTITDESFGSEARAAGSGNAFVMIQTAIGAISYLARDAATREEVAAAGWDMVVVDEAHHLTRSSPEYLLVESLATRASGLLLLTATPEQLGEESHFERLRLLDPDRYSSYDRYQKDRPRYRAVARLAARLLDGKPLAAGDAKGLGDILPRAAKSSRRLLRQLKSGDESARGPLLEALVDQHGPGRVVFRNARSVLPDFPERRLVPWKLDWLPGREAILWEQLAKEFVSDTGEDALSDYPYFFDPRASWLAGFLRDIAPEKVLVICRFKEKASALAEALRRASRASVALFHEGLSLLSRDRNAAWFAKDVDSAQALLSSEIGSEGRNFQFAHHLVLFDLPLGGELLEQRIGRLYRIGQERPVSIHVPYLPGSPQEMLFRFHHEGLGAFETSLPGAPAFDTLGTELRTRALAAVEAGRPVSPERFDVFLDEVRAARDGVLRELAAGRDRLLELGSFRPRRAESLIAEIRAWDVDETLESFVVDALDHLGVDLERVSPRTFVFRQGAKLSVASLPGLRSDEVGMTCDRERATREGELDFLTWDHPMVVGVMDLLLGGPSESAAVALLPGPLRGILLEAIFVLEATAPPGLDVSRFLPPTPLRVVVDHRLSDASSAFSSAALEGGLRDGRKELRYRDLGFLENLLPRMLDKARSFAEKQKPRRVEESLEELRAKLGAEVSRLRSLAEVNDHVDREEVAAAETRMARTGEAISKAAVRLDSLRLIWLGLDSEGR